MKLAMLFAALAALFATVPDLCEEVYLDESGAPHTDALGQTLSRHCQWTGPRAPVWDGDVCCIIGDVATCTTPAADGSCASGERYYCEYGEVDSAGVVTCYQPFPGVCEFGYCGGRPEVLPLHWEGMACCSEGGVCQEMSPDDLDECEENGGVFLWCFDGVTNEDGTVDCWD